MSIIKIFYKIFKKSFSLQIAKRIEFDIYVIELNLLRKFHSSFHEITGNIEPITPEGQQRQWVRLQSGRSICHSWTGGMGGSMGRSSLK